MAYRSSNTASSSVNVTSIAVTAPSGTATGDVVVGFGSWDGSGTSTIGVPSGWTSPSGVLQSTFDGQSTNAGYKVESGTPPSGYTFTSNITNDCVAAVAAYSGIDNASPLNQSNSASSSTGGASPRSMAVTGFTTTATCDLIYIGLPDWNGNPAGVTYTPPAGFTTRASVNNGNYSDGFLADQESFAAGATGTVTGTATLAAKSAGFCAYLMALKLAGTSFMPAPGIKVAQAINRASRF